MWGPAKSRRDPESLPTGHRGLCQPPHVGAGNQTVVFRKNKKYLVVEPSLQPISKS